MIAVVMKTTEHFSDIYIVMIVKLYANTLSHFAIKTRSYEVLHQSCVAVVFPNQ